MPTLEQNAREEIDRQLTQAGWLVQECAQMHVTAEPGVAVREFPLQTGYADYLVYLDGKAAGVIEAKPEGHKSLEESEDLPEPEVLAQEIVEDLQAALEQYSAVAAKLADRE